MEDKQKELLTRLEGLRKYQEEQEGLLKVSLFTITTKAPKKTFLILDKPDKSTSSSNSRANMYEMLGLSISNFAEVSTEPINIESENENDFEEITNTNDPDDSILLSSSDESSSHVNNYNNELVKKDNIVSPLKNFDELQNEEINEPQVPKRPFLKRGSGLTSRFRVPPDAFNLKNLPRYKYADRIKKNLSKNVQLKTRDLPKDTEPMKKKSEPAKKNLVRQAPVPTQQQQVSTKLMSPTNVALKIPPKKVLTEPEPQIEEWFKSRSKELESPETPKVAKIPKGVSWAQILSANNIMDSPIKVDQLLNPQNYDEDCQLDETSLFHLLEERVKNMNVDTSFSSIMRLVASLQNPSTSQDDESTLVNPEDPIIDDASTINLQLQPHPSDVNKKIIVDETSDDDEDDDGEEHRVRFSDNIEVVDDATDLSTDLEAIELSQTSTPNERKNFHEFKRKLMGHQKQPEVAREDLKEKSDLLKGKLADLESEMEALRQQNANIAKIRQGLELDRLQLENDRDDMLEQMKDERIKMEMQLHDDRLKVEQEKQKLEKMLKTPSKKEREEIAKLKETIDELKDELRTKEARHGSASARYRSQIKQLEKENQSLKLELEVVKKDNKKMELENARLRKDTNNKMLQEINKNIAKLAPSIEVPKKQQSEVVGKKAVTRKSEPAIKQRVKSVSDLCVDPSSNSSDEDQTISSKLMKENNPSRVRRSDPVRKSQSSISSDVLSEMKREIMNSDGSKDIWYPNGNLKKISPDGMLIRMLYFNKDIKETNINEGKVKYYYNETNTWHSTYIDGLEIIEYPE
jgi:centromere protein J